MNGNFPFPVSEHCFYKGVFDIQDIYLDKMHKKAQFRQKAFCSFGKRFTKFKPQMRSSRRKMHKEKDDK